MKGETLRETAKRLAATTIVIGPDSPHYEGILAVNLQIAAIVRASKSPAARRHEELCRLINEELAAMGKGASDAA